MTCELARRVEALVQALGWPRGTTRLHRSTTAETWRLVDLEGRADVSIRVRSLQRQVQVPR